MGRRSYISDETRKKMARMYLDGIPIRVIAAEAHVSYASVYTAVTANRRRKGGARVSSYKDVKALSDNIEHIEQAPRRLLINPESRVKNFCM